MNLNKMFVFIFVFFVFSAILISTMPAEFIQLGIEASYQDKEARDFFDKHDVTMYDYTLCFNLTYGEPEQFDFGLPEGQQLQFWWGQFVAMDRLQLRHLTDNFYGWWWGRHNLEVQEPYRSKLKYPDYPKLGLCKEDVVTNLYDEEYNASYCEFKCDHIFVRVFVFTYDDSWTLEESWDNHELKIITSYGIDWNSTTTNMWHIMAQLLAFQNPSLGIPGVGGMILSVGVGAGLWACIAILFFALITSVIPTISGWRGD
ncbi:hypothetical protein KAU92_00670 [Candidatus Bathyarchaeota archaeon]|nr:hypothetical protein [Candidatus Bathyarchaeota archaeon]